MTDLARFLILMLLSTSAFLGLIMLLNRTREQKARPLTLLVMSFMVVSCGMTFARYGHIVFALPWWIYYGVPAGLTVFLPPVVLRMHRLETARYIASAFLLAPAIHVIASLVLGWHDYMPFPLYVPSLVEIAHKIA
jgi:phosphatidylserine synthase